MGGDGGSIQRREEYTGMRDSVMGKTKTSGFKAFDHDSMRQSTRPEQTNLEQSRLDRVETCALSHQALAPPIVCCKLGMLYNKESLLRALLTKSLPARLAHIESRKAFFEIKLHTNTPQSPRTQNDRPRVPQFACPVVKLPINGRYAFVAIRTTGAVVSERALKYIGGTCPVTSRSFDPAVDLVKLHQSNPHDTLLNSSEQRLPNRKIQISTKAEKRTPTGVWLEHTMAEVSKVKCATSCQSTDVWKSLFSKRKRSEYESAETLMMAGAGSRSSQLSAI